MRNKKEPQIFEIAGPQMNVPAFSEKLQRSQVLVVTIPDKKENYYKDFYGQGPTIIRRADLNGNDNP